MMHRKVTRLLSCKASTASLTDMAAGPCSTPPLEHIDLPPVPPLLAEGSSSVVGSSSTGHDVNGHMAVDHAAERTNTLALLLPHLALFETPIQALLKEHYSQYGEIVHWAPVKGFGRVIVVYRSEDDALQAKLKGDRLKLDIDLPDLPSPPSERQSPSKRNGFNAAESEPVNGERVSSSSGREPSYFTSRHRRRKSYQARKG